MNKLTIDGIRKQVIIERILEIVISLFLLETKIKENKRNKKKINEIINIDFV